MKTKINVKGGAVAPKSRFEKGIDWNIVGINCNCQQEVMPVADELGEDINLNELLNEYRGKKCNDCGEAYRLLVEKGATNQFEN